jgi:hypothetical protein
LTDSNKRPAGTGSRPAGQQSSRKSSSSPTGTPRTGRRETQRRRHEQQSTLQRFRTPLIAGAVIAAVLLVGAFVFTSATAPVYACTSIDTVQTVEGQIGQVQPDMGNQHVNAGDEVTYPICPPASGKHVNRSGFGPLQPNVYGPDDNSVPNGWVHNLEHGGLVLLYSCEKGACDDAQLQKLQEFSNNFPTSTVCKIPTGVVGPVVARFEQMPTKYAALVWDRVLYMDELDTAKAYEFFSTYAERLADDGTFIAPPEPQCAPPSPGAATSPSPSSAPSASPAASPATASPSAAPAASPSAEPSPSPSAS